MRRLVSLGLLLSGVACRAREDAFTERVAAEARQQPGLRGARVVERFQVTLTRSDGTEYQMHLDNLWRDCAQRPDACDDSIARALRAGGEGQGTDDSFVKQENVRAVLKDPQWLENAQRAFKDATTSPEKAKESEIVRRPFVAGLSVVYVFDLPDGMRVINRGDLARLKLDEAGLDALAMKNLEAALPALQFDRVKEGSDIRVIHQGDSYEASRLILHQRWAAIAPQVKGDLLVAAPSRDFVYFTGSREDVAGLRALARGSEELGHGLTSALLRWTPGGWEAFP